MEIPSEIRRLRGRAAASALVIAGKRHYWQRRALSIFLVGGEAECAAWCEGRPRTDASIFSRDHWGELRKKIGDKPVPELRRPYKTRRQLVARSAGTAEFWVSERSIEGTLNEKRAMWRKIEAHRLHGLYRSIVDAQDAAAEWRDAERKLAKLHPSERWTQAPPAHHFDGVWIGAAAAAEWDERVRRYSRPSPPGSGHRVRIWLHHPHDLLIHRLQGFGLGLAVSAALVSDLALWFLGQTCRDPASAVSPGTILVGRARRQEAERENSELADS